ncbi:hypothetical protein ACO0K9_10005 [Undibacterium sp. Ji50W]|uniref:hypothetical protein n=1 Tax=Undibacterium sp. Ji50W TaxID=3413041 RepID=UPI003BF1DF5E
MSMLGEKKIPKKNLEDFDYFLSKILDKEIFEKKFVKRFFESDEDYLGDAEFNALKQCLLPHLTEVDGEKIMSKLYLWLGKDSWHRIEWLVSSNITFTKQPLAKLESRVLEKFKTTTDQSELDVLNKVAGSFGISLKAEILDESKDK